jgi:hypothetical protein
MQQETSLFPLHTLFIVKCLPISYSEPSPNRIFLLILPSFLHAEPVISILRPRGKETLRRVRAAGRKKARPSWMKSRA